MPKNSKRVNRRMNGHRAAAFVLALGLAMPIAAHAQQNSATPSSIATPAKVFGVEQISQMVAPIALYPDQLLAQVLMASTYPLEIVQAQRWVADPTNAKLQGDALATALEQQTWDPSVKSLVQFPQVLAMMNDQLDWTQRLGDAFLAQQADIMDAVQRLRRQAQDAGNLNSTEQQTVVTKENTETKENTVIIQPAIPQTVFVPNYNPSDVYGQWPYADYPPPYYPPPPAYYPAGYALAAGAIGFGVGMAVGGALWGWGDCDWGGDNISINANRYNSINSGNIRNGRATQLPTNSNNWRHDPSHRGGVAYRDQTTRAAFQRPGAAQTPANRDFRGFDTGRAGPGPGVNRASAGTTGISQNRNRQPGAGVSGRPASPRQQPSSRGGSSARQPTAGAGAARAPTAQRRQPAAFQGIGNGRQTQLQSNRGAASRQSLGQSRGGGTRAAAGAASRGGGGGAPRGGGGGGARGGGRR